MLKKFIVLLTVTSLALAGCSAAVTATAPAKATSVSPKRSLVISAIPDQDPEKLQRLYGSVATYLSKELGVPVIYKPVIDYTASVTAFKVGDLDLVWYGGLTGVQARLQVPGAQALIQRDIDATFHSVFIANAKTGIKPFEEMKGLQAFKGRTFTFGSDSSTSGRLMPQYFLKQAGLGLTDFKGEVGFSGSHDKTIKLVEAGSFDTGALNEQVWDSRVKSGEVDTSKVIVVWRSPSYVDYHWVLNPNVTQDFGIGMVEKIRGAFLKLDPTVPEHKEILDLFGAKKFITTENANYANIEAVARDIGMVK